MIAHASLIARNSLSVLVVLALTGLAAAQTPKSTQTVTLPPPDILGLKLNMTATEVTAALQAIGKGRILYHFLTPRFSDGKCTLPVDDRYTDWVGQHSSPTLSQTGSPYLVSPPPDDAPSSTRCPTFLTDITYFDLAERDQERPLATKLLFPSEDGPKLGPGCDFMKLRRTATNEEFRAAGTIKDPIYFEPLPSGITACEAIRIMMSPAFGQERAALISRVKLFRFGNPAFEDIRQGLASKYGAAPTATEDNTNEKWRTLVTRWSFDNSGQLLASRRAGGPSRCDHRLSTPEDDMTPPVTSYISSDCAVGVFARISSLRENPYLVRSFSVTVLHEVALLDLLEGREALAKKLNDEAARAQAAGAAGKGEKY